MFLKKKWIKYLLNVLFFSKYYNKKIDFYYNLKL